MAEDQETKWKFGSIEIQVSAYVKLRASSSRLASRRQALLHDR